MLIIILALSTISIVWLFQMIIDLAKNDLPKIAMKCFFIAVTVFTLLLIILNKLANYNCIKL